MLPRGCSGIMKCTCFLTIFRLHSLVRCLRPDIRRKIVSGARMEHKSRSKCLTWLGFEPQTSHLAAQHAKARPSRKQGAGNKAKRGNSSGFSNGFKF